MVEGAQLSTQGQTVFGPVWVLLGKMQGKSCEGNLGVSLDLTNGLSIQPRYLSVWGCNILGYVQGQEGFSEKNELHAQMNV